MIGMDIHAERRILHIDMDAYFAALEAQACPALKGKPLVVGGLPGGRGVVASASYEAREYGVRAGMSVATAMRLCRSLQLVPAHPSLYIDTSRRILKHLYRFSPNVEMFSIDEAFVDVTDLLSGPPRGNAWNEVDVLAREMAGSVESEFNLTCSIGAGPNKLLAKMASKLEKPRGISLLSRQAFARQFWHRSAEHLFGVGEKTASSLMIFGIETIGDLAEAPVDFLRSRFGVYGEALHAMAWGEDDSPVVASHEAPAAKSLGCEHTLQRDTSSPDEGLSLLLSLTEQVTAKMRSEGYAGRCVTIKMRYHDFSTLTRQRMLPHPTQETRDVYRTAKDLFLRNYCGGGIRLLGVTVGDLRPMEGGKQIALFPQDRRYSKYLEAVDQIRDTFGNDSLQPMGILQEWNGHQSHEARLESRGQAALERRAVARVG
jgi:DNA polymerase IV